MANKGPKRLLIKLGCHLDEMTLEIYELIDSLLIALLSNCLTALLCPCSSLCADVSSLHVKGPHFLTLRAWLPQDQIVPEVEQTAFLSQPAP